MSAAFDWLEKADTDLVMAKMALDRRPIMLAQAAFHVQQAAEKSVKALLVHLNVSFQQTHNMGLVAGLVPKNHHLAAAAATFIPTSHWAVFPRYPGGLGLAPQAPLPAPRVLADFVKRIVAFQADVEKDLPQIASDFVKALVKSARPDQRSRNRVGLWLEREVLVESLEPNAVVVREAANALRLLMPAGWQTGYEKVDGEWSPSGQTHTGRFAAIHVADRMRVGKLPSDRFQVKALEADSIVRANPATARGFDDLLAMHDGILQGKRRRTGPGRDGPEVSGT